MSRANIDAAFRAFRTILPPANPVTLDMHEAALGLAARYGFAFYDALIVAAALEVECETLLSEDMQNGMIVGGRLTIRNPF